MGGEWRPRPTEALNAELGAVYGVPIDLALKVSGLTAVAAALTRGDLVRAQLIALHLQLPEPSDLGKAARTPDEFVELVARLEASGLLAKTYDEQTHPRWPAGSPDSAGGRFTSTGSGSATASAGQAAPPKLTPVARPSKEQEDEEAAERDEAVCRSLVDPAVRARCWASVNARQGARARGKPLPPLVTWREPAPPVNTWPKLPIL
jgi:hypothetical protein